MQLAVPGKAFDRGDVRARRLRREHGAGLHRAPVHMHDAGAALAGVAADMRAGQSQLVAQEIDEQRAVLGLLRNRLAVHRQRDDGHWDTSVVKGDAKVSVAGARASSLTAPYSISAAG